MILSSVIHNSSCEWMMVEVTYQMVLSTLQTAGLLVGIFYYLISLNNQTKTRHMQIIQGVETSMTSKAGFNYEFMNATWEDYDDFMEKYGPDSGSDVWANNIAWVDAFELYGVYVREGMLDVRLVCLTSGGTYLNYWEKYGPIWVERRKRVNNPRAMIECEYLYHRIKDYFEKHPELLK